MPNLENLLNDLVIANRILAHEDVVDAYGHVSVRHPGRPSHFFLSRSLAPEFVTREDIIEFTLDGKPVSEESARSISNASSMARSSKPARSKRPSSSARMAAEQIFCPSVSPAQRRCAR